jgi:hypothetical protein
MFHLGGTMKKTLLLLLFLFVCLAATGCGPTLVVDSAGDELDSNLSDGVCKTVNNDCTLRAAIMEANVSDDISKITFQNVSNINPVTPLPALTENNTRINGEGKVTINGLPNELGLEKGLEIQGASNVYIQGMSIKNFYRGIFIDATDGSSKNNIIGALPSEAGDLSKGNVIINNMIGITINGEDGSNNTISGNFIGVDTDGITPRPNEVSGVQISGSANNNLIGSLSGTGLSAGGNLISGNTGVGVSMGNASMNHISGNFIGTDINGAVALGNGGGIEISGGSNNFIGIEPTGTGHINLISGSNGTGIWISGSNHNYISGNYIGTDLLGTSDIGNHNGIRLENGSKTNIIGTNGDGTGDHLEGNLISGNDYRGLEIDQNSTNNNVAGNYIGVNFDTSAGLGNGGSGVSIYGNNNRIGTNADGVSDSLEANVVSGNGTTGIYISSTGNLIAGNLIGLDKTGLIAIGNLFDGIVISPSGSNNLIGTNGDGFNDSTERNIISGNCIGSSGSGGIEIFGYDNVIAGNYIGTDITGNAALGNLRNGLVITGPSAGNNLIGTDGDGLADEAEGNLISGNESSGIWLFNATSNQVSGNYIGTDTAGSAAIPNGHAGSFAGIYISHGSTSNTIGSNSDNINDGSEGNLVSGNSPSGITISGASTQNNTIAGNKIGTDITGTSALGNGSGIFIAHGASNNHIGTNGDGFVDLTERNLISGNPGPGIILHGSNNLIAGNYIGTDISGATDLGNGLSGIRVTDNSFDNEIGGSVERANLIAFNDRDGVRVVGPSTTNILISMNSIHSNDETAINLLGGQSAWFSPNDPGDIDTGPNDMMNFPELNYASSIMVSTAITGQIIDGLPNTQFKIEFYSNSVCDSPGNHGEGKNYIGSSIQQTGNNGDVSFLVTFPAIVPPGSFITSTATTDNKTSEFSACVEVQDAQIYSQEEDPCDQFDPDLMTLTTFPVRPESGLFILYVKNPAPYPVVGPEDAELEYYASLGDASTKCGFEGFEDRVYCYFYLSETYFNTKQLFKLNSNLCIPPFYVNEEVNIFAKGPDDPAASDDPVSCHEDLGKLACEAAGGEYKCVANCTCVCP